MCIRDSISVDCVIFGFDFENLNVLLVERTLFDDNNEVVFSDLTLTGNHIYRHEDPVSYTHLRAHETVLDIVCRLLLEKKKKNKKKKREKQIKKKNTT